MKKPRKNKETARKMKVAKVMSRKMVSLQKKADKLGEKIWSLQQQRDAFVYEFRALDKQKAELLK